LVPLFSSSFVTGAATVVSIPVMDVQETLRLGRRLEVELAGVLDTEGDVVLLLGRDSQVHDSAVLGGHCKSPVAKYGATGPAFFGCGYVVHLVLSSFFVNAATTARRMNSDVVTPDRAFSAFNAAVCSSVNRTTMSTLMG
jgi:hypothetical protein